MSFLGINLINKCRNVVTDVVNTSRVKLADVPADEFVRSKPKFNFSKKIIDDLTPEKHRLHCKQVDIQHEKRLQKFATDTELTPKEVDKDTFQVLYDIQYESKDYLNVKDKLRQNEKLTASEQSFLDRAKQHAVPCKDDTVLWRCLTPYDGFDEEINNGFHTMSTLSSTNKFYNEFFSIWGKLGIHSKGDKFYGVKPVYLKIKVPKGTPVLDCNATHMGRNLRMNSETVLLPGKCTVDNIDDALDVIEMTYKID